MSPNDLDTRTRLQAIVGAAGEIALGFFRPGDATQAKVSWKGDGSPVTEADYAVNVFLEKELRALWPDAAWLSEESVDDHARLDATRVIVVDPIDGTRGFARGDRNWCVAVALVERGRPIIGIVHAPASYDTYTACVGQGACLNGTTIAVAKHGTLPSDISVSAPTVLADKMRKAGLQFDYRPKIASLALRIARVASGDYDCCFATRDSNDWDLAAADLVLQEAGGLLAGLDGLPLLYNRAETRHGMLIAAASPLPPLFLDALKETEALR